MAPALRLLLLLMVIRPCTGDVNLWPMPKSVSNGGQTVYISKDLKMTVVGSNYSDKKAILKDAFVRMVAIVEQDHVISERYERSPVLVGVNVVVHSPDDEINFGVDESYSLFVPSTGHPLHAQVEVSNACLAKNLLES